MSSPLSWSYAVTNILQGYLHAHCSPPLGHWPLDLLRSTELLPPGTRQSSFILQIGVPAQDHSLELCGRHFAELLFECALRTKLEL